MFFLESSISLLLLMICYDFLMCNEMYSYLSHPRNSRKSYPLTRLLHYSRKGCFVLFLWLLPAKSRRVEAWACIYGYGQKEKRRTRKDDQLKINTPNKQRLEFYSHLVLSSHGKFYSAGHQIDRVTSVLSSALVPYTIRRSSMFPYTATEARDCAGLPTKVQSLGLTIP